jgi:hypothetical protein
MLPGIGRIVPEGSLLAEAAKEEHRLFAAIVKAVRAYESELCLGRS